MPVKGAHKFQISSAIFFFPKKSNHTLNWDQVCNCFLDLTNLFWIFLYETFPFWFIYLCTRKCPLRGHILAPPEGLRGLGLPGVNPGVNPRGQGVISRRFKRKKIFVTDTHTDTWTDRRAGRNSDVDRDTVM